MVQGKTKRLEELEASVRDVLLKDHADEMDLQAGLLNTYIDGFNLIGSFTITEENEVELAWLKLLIRSFHSLRSAILLEEIGYYGQAIAILRAVTEDWLKCKDCGSYRPTLDALLYAKHKFGDRKLKLRDSDIAERVGERDVVYEQDYRFQSNFVHPSRASLSILFDPDTHEARCYPVYDNTLFLACCELFIRNGLRMTEFMDAILSRISEDKQNVWKSAAGEPCNKAADWLKALQVKYGKEKK